MSGDIAKLVERIEKVESDLTIVKERVGLRTPEEIKIVEVTHLSPPEKLKDAMERAFMKAASLWRAEKPVFVYADHAAKPLMVRLIDREDRYHELLESLDPRQLEKVAEQMKVLSNAERLKILQLLAKGSKYVAELGESLDISKGAVWQHLKVLQEKGYITQERERGKYKMNDLGRGLLHLVANTVFCLKGTTTQA